MGNPYGWPPYAVSRDCSLGFCSMYCPQWCYFYFPPPPPPSHSSFTLSPLLTAVIIVVSTAFIIAAGYLIAVKYCSNRRRSHPFTTLSVASTWLPPPSTGLDSSLINKLTATYIYRRSGVAASDCPVCLGEFRDGDSLRLLPKCSHAFHQSCIDTWLGSHSNCPLCRAGVVAVEERRGVEMAEGGFVVAGDSEEESSSVEGRRDGDDVAIMVVDGEDEVRTAAESPAGRSPASVKRTSTSRRGNS